VINLMILMHDPIPAVLGLAIVLCGDPIRRVFFSKSKVERSTVPITS
jgi:basic amino acid/polyamine antiporter, APA family